MNLLGLIQAATGELGLAVPTYIAGNQTADVVQQLALLNAAGQEILREYPWQFLQTEYRFSTQFKTLTGAVVAGSPIVTGLSSTAGLDTTFMCLGSGAPVPQDTFIQSVDSANQVTLTQAATTSGSVSLSFCKTQYSMPSDYDRISDETQWDKSKRWKMLGPCTAQEWQWLKSGYISTGPRVRWRLLGGKFQTWPPLASAEYLGFEYVSNGWVTSAAGARQSAFAADTDTCFLPDRLMVLALKLKYFEVKGFDTGALERDYAKHLEIAKANDGGASVISMAPNAPGLLIGWEQLPDSGYGA